jgi:hypothetical protein
MAKRGDKNEAKRREQRRRVIVTALIFAAIALAFYVYSIVRLT